MADGSNPGRMHYIDEIEQQLGRLVSWVEIANRNNHPNISVISENIICGLLNLLYGWNLTNANSPSHPNFPGVDLVDDTQCIAVQVTAKNSIDKVKDMLEKFYRHNLDERFSRLILLEITNQEPTQGMRDKKEGCFYGKRDIWNIPRLVRDIQNQDIDQLEKIAKYLDEEVGSLYAAPRKDAELPRAEKPPREAPKKKQPPTRKESRTGKKKHWLWAILAVALLAAMLLRDKNLEEMPEALSGYTVIINEQAVSLPTTFSRLEEMGWVFQDTSQKGDWVAPGVFNQENRSQTALQTELTNGYGTMDVWYGNPSDHSLRTEDCVVYQISLSIWGIENSATGKPMNRIRITDSFVLGQSKWDDQKRPEGYLKIKRSTLTDYRYTEDDNHWYSFMFDGYTGILTDVVVCNREQDTMEELIGEDYDVLAPAYDAEALLRWIGADLAFQVGEHRIPVGCTVEKYLDMGYTLDECPEYLASMEHDDLYFHCDKETRVKGKVYNPFPRALVSEWCYMSCLDSRDIHSEVDEYIFLCTIGEETLQIPKGLTQEALIQLLERMGLDWINSSTDSITFFPNAYTRDIAVTCILSGDTRTVSRIQVDLCEALRGYFFGSDTAQ